MLITIETQEPNETPIEEEFTSQEVFLEKYPMYRSLMDNEYKGDLEITVSIIDYPKIIVIKRTESSVREKQDPTWYALETLADIMIMGLSK